MGTSHVFLSLDQCGAYLFIQLTLRRRRAANPSHLDVDGKSAAAGADLFSATHFLLSLLLILLPVVQFSGDTILLTMSVVGARESG